MVSIKIAPMLKESSILNQFQHENETWKRILGFIREENINIKNRLSEIVKDMQTDDYVMLEQIEFFQNRFLEEDEKIRLLKKEVDEQDHSLLRDIYEDGDIVKRIKRTQARLRMDMEKTEREFNRLKFDFNNYLSGAL